MSNGNPGAFFIKASFLRSPKEYLDETMKEVSSGTWIFLEATIGEPNLLYIDYNYKKKTVMTFIWSRGTGSMVVGNPYTAKFPDKYGNLFTVMLLVFMLLYLTSSIQTR